MHETMVTILNFSLYVSVRSTTSMKFRRRPRIRHLALVVLIVIFAAEILPLFGSSEHLPSDTKKLECKDDNQGECKNKNQKGATRVITQNELEQKTGADGSQIWLSILGDVYDVSQGASFYGKGTSYGTFAGRDCSVCFVSGVFTAEEAQKNTDELSDTMLAGILDWCRFYATHSSYKFVGFLVDPRYYNEKGHPTTNLLDLRKRLTSIQRSIQK